MCGIVGYIGTQKAEPILIDGLKRLEYRGYDSAGLAFLQNGGFQVIRAKGKLSELVSKLKDKNFTATIGIGHTRWATHGRPDETNAHPHHAKDVVLVHNGIIENYKPLKDTLIKKGHKIVSETDTEVICHLIQDFLNSGKMSFVEALRATLKELRGAYSLVILDRNDSEHIYVARKGSPLVIGLGKGENLVASDIPALLAHTNEVVFLEDDQMAILSREKVDFFDFTGNPIEKKSKVVSWTTAQAEKGGYKHFMIKEIHEQPRVLADTMLGRIDRDSLDVNLGDEADAIINRFVTIPDAHIQIVACGTSWHAGLVAKYWIENLARIPVSVDLSSEFRYRQPLVNKKTLVIAISQSGETADTLAAIRESKKLGATVVAICNVIESSIPRESDATIYTHAGPEIGVASTKAFSTQMLILYLLAIKTAQGKDLLKADEARQRIQAVVELPAIMKNYLRTSQHVLDITERIYKHEHCYFLARGIQYPIALEGALKLKEISYVHAEGYAGGEMKHGPIALIEEGVPVVAVMLNDSLYEKMLSNVQEVRARGAMVFAVIQKESLEDSKSLEGHFLVPDTHADLMPFLTILPLQLLAYHVADAKGTDVDQPRNLAKSVTVE